MVLMQAIAEIKTLAQADVLGVLAALGVHAKPRGNYISICNPRRKEKNPSFTVWISGPSAGAFKDFGGPAQGDIIDLVAYLGGWSGGGDKAGRAQALAWLRNHLGLQRMSHLERAELARLAQAQALTAAKRREGELAEDRRRAFALWLQAEELAPATAAWQYLKHARGIDLELLPRGPRGGQRQVGTLRSFAAHRHIESGNYFPTMIAGCVDWVSGEIRAVHRTYLARDCHGKAAVRPNKKVWPSYAGLAIPLWRGSARSSIKEAAELARKHGAYETLVLTEGIEDGLSAVLAAPQFRTWAYVSAGNLANIKVPPFIDAVIVHRQFEPTNLAVGQLFERGKRALETQGVTVAEVMSHAGKDLNDMQQRELA